MRIFISHSSSNNLQARAVKAWLVTRCAIPADDIFLDIDPENGIRTGERWKIALRQAANRCEAIICLLSQNWEDSKHCNVEYLYAEDLRKTIIVARIEDMEVKSITAEWQRCDLFPVEGSQPEEIPLDTGENISLSTDGLERLRTGLWALGIGVEHFGWPPPGDPSRAPYRGWATLDRYDAAVYFGRDAEIMRGLDLLRGMRTSGIESMLVIQGPSGAGKSAYMRAGLLPRLYRDDRRFLPMGVVRPARDALTGDTGLAASIFAVREGMGLTKPTRGEIKNACRTDNLDQLRGWLQEARAAAHARTLDTDMGMPAPTLVLPLDQAEELFAADAKLIGAQFLDIAAGLMQTRDGVTPSVIMVATIRSDSYESLQTAPQLARTASKSFNDLKAMSPANFGAVITGPAQRVEREGQRLDIAPDLITTLTEECATADALPLLALTLSRLYTDYADDGDLTLDEYHQMGGLTEVVQREVDQILGQGDTRTANLGILRGAFIPLLATVDPDSGNPRRNLAKWNELPPDSHDLIRAFIDSRLLVVRTPRDRKDHPGTDAATTAGEQTVIVDNEAIVEVALESLLRNWTELASWLTVEGEDLKLAEKIRRDALDWDRHGRTDDYLGLYGTRLDDAERICATQSSNRGDWWRLSATFIERCRAIRSREAADKERAALENERRRAAEVQLLREKKENAEAYARDIRDREIQLAHSEHELAESQNKLDSSKRRLRRWAYTTAAAAIAVVVTLVVAVHFEREATDTKQAAAQQFREATALRLANEAEAVLSGRSPDGDFRALHQAVAAPAVDPGVDQSVLLDMNEQRRDLLKLVNTGEPVTSVAAGANGTLIATGDAQGVLRIWKADSVEQSLPDIDLSVHGAVWSVAFIGNALITGTNDGTVLRIDLASMQQAPLLVTGDTGAAVRTVAVSSDDQTVAAASVDGTVRAWDAGHGYQPLLPPIRTSGDALTVAVHGDLVATGSKNGVVELWRSRAHDRPVRTIAVGGGEIWSVAFSPNGQQLAIGGQNPVVTLWSVNGGNQPELKIPHGGGVWAVAYNAAGDRLVTGGVDDHTRVWNVTAAPSAPANRLINDLVGDNGDVKSAIAVGERVVTASDDGSTRLWRATPEFAPASTRRAPVTALSFLDDATVALDSTGDLRAVGADIPLLQFQNRATAASAIDSTANTVTVATRDGAIQTWSIADRTPIGPEIDTGSDDVTALAVGGGSIASRSGRSPSIRLWNLRDGGLAPAAIAVGNQAIDAIAVSADGTKLAAAVDGGIVRIWDASNGSLISDALPADQHPEFRFRHISSMVFSAESTHIVTAARGDDSVREFDIATGTELGLMYGHHRDVAAVDYSHDGRYIASGDNDGMVRIWDSISHRPVGAPIISDHRPVTRIAFGPGDQTLIIGLGDGAVRTIPGPKAWLRELCSKLTHNMSQTEWNSWVTPSITDEDACHGLTRRPSS